MSFSSKHHHTFCYKSAMRCTYSCVTAWTFIGFYKLSRHALSEWCNE